MSSVTSKIPQEHIKNTQKEKKTLYLCFSLSCYHFILLACLFSIWSTLKEEHGKVLYLSFLLLKFFVLILKSNIPFQVKSILEVNQSNDEIHKFSSRSVSGGVTLKPSCPTLNIQALYCVCLFVCLCVWRWVGIYSPCYRVRIQSLIDQQKPRQRSWPVLLMCRGQTSTRAALTATKQLWL